MVELDSLYIQMQDLDDFWSIFVVGRHLSKQANSGMVTCWLKSLEKTKADMATKKESSENSLSGYPEKIAIALTGRELSAPKALLERYPRIVEMMGVLWGKEKEFTDYVDDLAFVNRSDERQGFDPDVLQDVFFMKELHDALHGKGNVGFDKEVEAARTAKSKTLSGRVEPKSKKKDNAGLWHLEGELMRVKARMEAKRLGKAGSSSKKIGEILIEAGCIDEPKLEVALRAQTAAGKKMLTGSILVKANFIKEADVQRALCLQQGVQLLDLDMIDVDKDAMLKIPRDVQLNKKAVPVAKSGSTTLVAISNPVGYAEMDWLGFVVGGHVELAWASEEAIDRRLAGVDKREAKRTHAAQASEVFVEIAKAAAKPLAERKAQQAAVFELAKKGNVGAEDPTVSDMVRRMLLDAKKFGASDIHIEASPKGTQALVRMRIDGDLSIYANYEKAAHEAVVSRIKISSDLDISERRRPQDGKMSVVGEFGEKIEARVSSIPSVGGYESITLRLISSAEPVALAKLGMDDAQLEQLELLLNAPHGLALVCGPTGSGKTTTLHSMLSKLNTPSKKIWTVEDPVEIVQEGLVQTQAQPKIGYGFDAALRAFMRADPDVIMVGEVRDEATASAALEAALTGHLVLSTLHTNSACETATRLLDLGVDAFAFSDSLRGIVAQRLARKLCQCAKSRRATPSELDELAREHYLAMGDSRSSRSDRDRWLVDLRKRLGGEIELREPVGCDECRGSGHRGRVGVHEVLIASELFKKALSNRASGGELLKIALAEGFVPLKARALDLACSGLITISEARSMAL